MLHYHFKEDGHCLYLWAIVILIFSIMVSGYSDQILVPDDYSKIQDAINAANNGDEIIVSPGTYAENINFNGKNIILRSTEPTNSSIVDQTIICGNNSGTVITFHGTEPESCLISGFTITNGGSTNYGAAIRGNRSLATIHLNHITKNSVSSANPTIWGCNGKISENIISDNGADWGGAGIDSCNGVITNNIISNNAQHGCVRCNGIIRSNTISKHYDAGLSDCNGTIKKNIISENYYGFYNCNANILENVISDNSYGIYNSDNGIISNNVIEKNNGAGIDYSESKIQYNTISENIFGIRKCNSIIDNNEIFNNSSVGIHNCGGTLSNNIIRGNQGSGIQDFTGIITDNIIKGNQNGGIYTGEGVVKNNIIKNNYTSLNGAGIYLFVGTIENNIISLNYAGDSGGGLYRCDSIIKNNYIHDNIALEGGGISECHNLITANIISNNISFLGGGISRCDDVIENNTIFGNEAEFGSALFWCKATIKNCIIWDNISYSDKNIYNSSEPSYSCIQDWHGGGTGNISKDPLLTDPISGDFHLRRCSPCIDAGDPAEEYYDACLPPGLGTVINDMGAYGGPNNCGFIFPFSNPALVDLTQYGDVWGAANSGAPPFETPARWGWPGLKYDPENGWYPLKGNADASGIDDIIQITQYGDAWVALSGETSITSPTRWGWLGFKYEEKAYKGWLPLTGDVDGTGSDDLIQVTEHGDAWVAISLENAFDAPTRWGWPGFEFSRGELGTQGAIPLAGDVNGDGLCDLIQITQYGDAWVALSTGIGFNTPTRWGWLGFKYAPFDGWYPMVGDVNADGADDLIQITPTGDAWVSLSTKSAYSAPTRWGWLNYYYNETQGYYTMIEDMNADGALDLIQITPSGEVLVAASKGDSFDEPEHWGWIGFKFDREEGYLPFYLDY